jgi:hypothetical protein
VDHSRDNYIGAEDAPVPAEADRSAMRRLRRSGTASPNRARFIMRLGVGSSTAEAELAGTSAASKEDVAVLATPSPPP